MVREPAVLAIIKELVRNESVWCLPHPESPHLDLQFQRSLCDLGTCESLEIMTVGDTFLHRWDKPADRPDNMLLKPGEVLACFFLDTDKYHA